MEKKFVSLKRKVFLTLVLVAGLSLLSVSCLIFYRLSDVKDTLEESHEQVRQQTVGMSSETTMRQSLKQLTASTKAGAELADDVFSDFKRSVEIIAADATRLYDNADAYSSIEVARPDKDNAGKLTVQLLYSEKADPDSAAIRQEMGLLGNLQNTLLGVHESYEPIVADCIATESGIMIMADLISDTKFDENGDYLPYEANERPWYIGVKTTGETFFTKLSRDAHTSKTGIMCGAPVYHDGKIVAVVEAGMYLDNLEQAIEDAGKVQTEGASICVINEDGELVCSTAESGELAVDFENMTDLRTSKNTELGTFLSSAIEGSADIAELTIDGTDVYIISAPLETVGWAYVITIPADTVDADTLALSGELDTIAQNASKDTEKIMSSTIRNLIFVAFIILIFVAILANTLSQSLVAPIAKLTEAVKKLDGNELDFNWNSESNDEIFVLGQAFEKMTVRMKNYIEEVKNITAEKERIGAELNVATRIQADMLPRIFPAFPDRPEFDVYATMNPAKEVGGDFYDFFMVDEDHVALVIADVSSKGVPAALFMVIAKTLIKNQAQYGRNVAEVFKNVNNELCEGNDEGMFVTAFIAVVNIKTGHMMYANAGHEPFLHRHNGEWTWIYPESGFILAGLPDFDYSAFEMNLTPGDRLFMFTDGVSEAQDIKNELFGEDRITESIKAHGDEDISEIPGLLRKDIDAFVGEAPQFDDITMLVFEYTGE